MVYDHNEVRSKARLLLEEDWHPNLVNAGALLGGMVAILGILGGALGTLGQFNGHVLTAFVLACIVVPPAYFMFLEIRRLRKVSDSLRQVLSSEKFYEGIILEARKERDGFSRELTQLQARQVMIEEGRSMLEGVLTQRIQIPEK